MAPRTILVTGSHGFIGSNLVHMWLKEHPEDQIVGLDELTYAADVRNVAGLERFTLWPCDVSDREAVAQCVSRFQFDGCIHLAAETHVDRSLMGPLKFYRTNVMGTAVLLEALRSDWQNRGVNGRFVLVSTDEVFGHLGPNDPPFGENSVYAPRSPYSASKAGADHAAEAYHASFGMNVVITHCSNNYGPRQNREKLVPNTILSALERKPVPIYGKGDNVRDWISVEDHCWGLMRAFEHGKAGEHYLFGGSSERRNVDLVRWILLEMDRIVLDDGQPRESFADLMTFVEDRKGHDHRYAVDWSKAKQELDWQPIGVVETRMEETIRWYVARWQEGYFKQQDRSSAVPQWEQKK